MELVGTRKTVYVALRTLLAFVLALILGGSVFFAAGFNPVQVYKLIFLGAFGSGEAILTTLSYATPLIFTGLAFAFAQHAKVMNLGTEGQLYVGAMVAALIGGYLPPLPRMLFVPLILVVSCLCAGCYAGIAGFLSNRFGANMVIVTLMQNYVAQLFCSYLVNNVFVDDQGIARTAALPQQARIGKLMEGHYLSASILIGVALVAVVWFLLNRTRLGYRLHFVGSNPASAETAGINTKRMMLITLLISGALAGFCGATQVMGVQYRFTDGFSSGYGFEGIAVAALAGNNPLTVLLSAILWGGLKSGASEVNRIASIPMDVISIIQALIVVFMVAPKLMDALCTPMRKLLAGSRRTAARAE